MRYLLLGVIVLGFSMPVATASKRAANHAYVQSMESGVFYARCIPDADTGTAGTTKIYRVRRDGDELIDVYHWYSPDGVVLGWSPIAGKVAVMSLREKHASDEKQVEFRFHLGGKLLRTYTTRDLTEMGVGTMRISDGVRAAYKVLGCEQIPRTNEYLFSIQVKGDESISFDVLTGKIRE